MNFCRIFKYKYSLFTIIKKINIKIILKKYERAKILTHVKPKYFTLSLIILNYIFKTASAKIQLTF